MPFEKRVIAPRAGSQLRQQSCPIRRPGGMRQRIRHTPVNSLAGRLHQAQPVLRADRRSARVGAAHHRRGALAASAAADPAAVYPQADRWRRDGQQRSWTRSRSPAAAPPYSENVPGEAGGYGREWHDNPVHGSAPAPPAPPLWTTSTAIVTPAPGRQLAAAADLLAAARQRSRAVLASASGTRRPALPSPNGGMFP